MKPLLLTIFCFSAFVSYAQFKADNVKYKTVFPEELCKTLEANPNFILLDVRSDAEFNDTMSSSPSLNIGHLQNAMHIDIRELPSRWKELSAYKDRPVFIYCSHSQRSRRASRFLADSGFTKIFNVNGGLTNFYAQGIQYNPCHNYEIITNVPYKIVSPKQLASTKTSYYIIDLRNDSAFNGTSLDERTKMEGRFANAVNIPFEKFQTNAFAFPDKPILLVDEFGDQSPVAAKALMGKGFKNVSILFNGMSEWVGYTINADQKPSMEWKNFSNYHLISPEEFNKWMNDKKNFAIIDVRPKDQFSSQSKSYWQNIGQIKNAVNIPFVELSRNISLPSSKSEPIVVYGFSGENEIFNAAKWLKDNGYKNVYVLAGGIFNLRWAAHNLKNKMYLNELVINIAPENE